MSTRTGGSLDRIRQLVRKEFRQVFRDPRLARVIFVAPLLQLVVFGYAVSTDIRDTATFVVDHDRTPDSRELVQTLTASGDFRVVGASASPRDLVRALDHGTAVVGLEIPAGFASDLQSGRTAVVQVVVDGTNSNLATLAQGYAEAIIAEFGARRRGGLPGTVVEVRERAFFNPELSSRNYNVPAVIGAIMLLVCLLLTSLAVVREREIGTLEQLMVSPLKPWELIAGKTLPFALIGLADMGLVTGVALLWFGVPLNGSVWLLLAASVLYLLSGLGLGLLISSVSRTQQEAFMASFLVFMPTVLLSGFLFPVSSMPELFRGVSLLNPVAHYLEVVRAVFLKGAGLGALWPRYLALLVIGGSILVFAASRFRKTTS